MFRLRRFGFVLLQFLASVWAAAEETGANAAFEGAWLGTITAPNARTEFGLAFTTTPRGQLVSVYFPEMFLYGANFGPAAIHEEAFQLPALNLTLHREGDRLVGSFALARLPVELRRGGTFRSEPPVPDLPAAPPAAWTHALGASAWASPVAGEHTVYVGTTDGVMHAVGSDGRERWQWRGSNPLYGEAVIFEDALFFVDDAAELIALNRIDGTLRWRLPLHDGAATLPPRDETFNHRAPAPVIDARGVLYVGSPRRGVYAVRPRSGKVLWTAKTSAPVYAPVCLVGTDLIAATFDGTLLRLERRAGREVMHTQLPAAVVSAPVVVGPQMIVGCRDYLLYGLDARTGAARWRDSYWFSWVESTPRLADGLLYLGGSDYRRVSAIVPDTGERKWSTDVHGLSWGSPVVTGQTVFAGTAGQTLAGTVITHEGGIVALSRETGAVKWRYRSPAAPGAAFTGFAGSLVVTDGLVIGAGVDGTLRAFPAE